MVNGKNGKRCTVAARDVRASGHKMVSVAQSPRVMCMQAVNTKDWVSNVSLPFVHGHLALVLDPRVSLSDNDCLGLS